jgi:germacradienol/geosmin synthase
VPDPVDHLEMRRQSVGGDISPRLVMLAHGLDLSAELLGSGPFRELANAFDDVVALHNDLFSFEKEVVDGEWIYNSVVVFQNFLGCDIPQAVAIVDDLLTARLHQFEHIVADDLPVLFDELDLDTGARHQALRYVDLLRSWIAGNHQWSAETGRYPRTPTDGASPARQVRLSRTATGLGTSAARLRSLLDSPRPQPSVQVGVGR